MRSLIAAVAQAGRAVQHRRFVKRCQDVRAAQEATLAALVRRLQSTEVGRRLGIARVTSLDRLQELVPLAEFRDYQDDMNATFAGTDNVIVPETPVFFAVSTGTTGTSKRLPVTRSYMREVSPASAVFLYHLYRDHPPIRRGKILMISGRLSAEVSPRGVPVGTGTGYNFQNMPAYIQRMFASPFAAMNVEDPTARAYATAVTALRHDVTTIVSLTTLPLAFLGHCMQEHGDRLLRDISEGTLEPPAPMSAAERQALLVHVRPDRERARILARRAGTAGALTPRAAWPSLHIISTLMNAGGGAYLHQVRERFGEHVAVRAMTYTATEGAFAIPVHDDDPSGILALGTHVFEFVPVDDEHRRIGDPVLADQLEQGKRYSLVLSSGIGVWRYQMFDIVECTGFFHQAPRIAFVQREHNALELAGDRTLEIHVRTAVERVCGQHRLRGRYCAGPGQGTPPRYLLAVAAAPGLDRDALARDFDAAMQALAPRYAEARTAGRLAAAEVEVLAPEAFLRFDTERANLEVGSQSKPVLFSCSADFCEQLMTAARGAGARRGDA